jgi:hypothetical protein
MKGTRKKMMNNNSQNILNLISSSSEKIRTKIDVSRRNKQFKIP